jgi:hypothetical protein
VFLVQRYRLNTSLRNLDISSSRIVILISVSSNKTLALWYVKNEVPSELAMTFFVLTYRETYYYDQYSEANMMHFIFSLLRIKGLHMFQTLLAHPQELLHKWHLVYCVCVMSVGCTGIEVRGTAQVALGILCVCYVSWLHQD